MRLAKLSLSLGLVAAFALACGGGELEGDATATSVEAGGGMADVSVASTGDPVVDLCSKQAKCGCLPDGQDEPTCVSDARDLISFGFRTETYSCMAGLACADLCAETTTAKAQPCMAMFEQDYNRAMAQIQQLSAQQQQIHETNMQIIGNMGTTGTQVVDEFGNVQYEY